MGGGGGILSPITDTLFGKPQTVATPNYSSAAEQTAAGNLKNAQLATAANRVNQVTPYSSLNYTQTTDANGNPVWSATQSLNPAFESTFNSLASNARNAAATPFTAGPAVNTQIDTSSLPSYGINPGETYSDAIMRRLQPQQERQSKSLDAQLANQGIMPGSEAYNNAKTQLAQSQNDQLTSAIVGGFQTGLAANQQGYNQALTNYQLPLATLSQFRSATAPSYVNPYQQPAVAGPDYLGAYTTGANAELASQASERAGSSGLTQGLFDLAGTAISNPGVFRSVYDWWNS